MVAEAVDIEVEDAATISGQLDPLGEFAIVVMLPEVGIIPVGMIGDHGDVGVARAVSVGVVTLANPHRYPLVARAALGAVADDAFVFGGRTILHGSVSLGRAAGDLALLRGRVVGGRPDGAEVAHAVGAGRVVALELGAGGGLIGCDERDVE